MRLRVATLVLSCVTLAACSAGGTTPGSDDPLPDPIVDTEVTSDVDYVALGDSFSAGPFIGTMRTDPTGCARSKDNYPAFLADWLDVKSYTDVTCSAATTQDLTAAMTMFDGGTAVPQLDAVTADTDLVTLGMGGNDFGIYDSLIRCQDGRLSPCPVDGLESDAGEVAGNIRRAVREIRSRAPEADVYVVGYPDILPTEGTCGAIGVPADVLGPIADVVGLLNGSLRTGATAAGASYVDMEAVSEGHDMCAKGRAWVNGPRFRAGIAAPFHPKINGMRAVASTVYEQVTGEEPDVTEYAEPDPDVIVLNQPAG